MERDIAFIILALVGFALLLLFILSVRFTIKKRRGYQSDLDVDIGRVDDLVDDDFDLFGSQDEMVSKYNHSTEAMGRGEPIIGNPQVEPPLGSPLADEMARSSFLENDRQDDSQKNSQKHLQDNLQDDFQAQIDDDWPSDLQGDLKQNEQNQTQTKPPKIIALYIKPEEGEAFVGYDLLQSLLAVGLRFGDMSIFHRHEQHSGKGKILFSLAQATEPGVFDINAIGACRCAGLTLFMQLIGPEHNMAAFKKMLETAQQLADDLNGTVTDKTQQRLQAELLQEFQRQIQAHSRHCEGLAL